MFELSFIHITWIRTQFFCLWVVTKIKITFTRIFNTCNYQCLDPYNSKNKLFHEKVGLNKNCLESIFFLDKLLNYRKLRQVYNRKPKNCEIWFGVGMKKQRRTNFPIDLLTIWVSWIHYLLALLVSRKYIQVLVLYALILDTVLILKNPTWNKVFIDSVTLA